MSTPSQRLKKRRRLLKEALRIEEFVRGSVVLMKRRCSSPGCRRCAAGTGHPTWVLTVSSQGKTRTIYLGEQRVGEAGRRVAQRLLADQLAKTEESMDTQTVFCPECGGPMRRPKKKAPRNLDTFSGPIRYERRHAICDRCNQSFSPSGPPAGDSAAGGVGPVRPQGL